MKRVAIWNGGKVPEALGGGTRGNVTFNPRFDMGLLSEEVKEFYVALAEDDLIEMVDAVCDMQFVFEGIEFKYGMIQYGYEETLDNVESNTSAFNIIHNYYSYHMGRALQLLESEGLSQHDIKTCYRYVCEANEQKGTAKDEKGKTIKGSNWVNPAQKIGAYLNKKGLL